MIAPGFGWWLLGPDMHEAATCRERGLPVTEPRSAFPFNGSGHVIQTPSLLGGGVMRPIRWTCDPQVAANWIAYGAEK